MPPRRQLPRRHSHATLAARAMPTRYDGSSLQTGEGMLTSLVLFLCCTTLAFASSNPSDAANAAPASLSSTRLGAPALVIQ